MIGRKDRVNNIQNLTSKALRQTEAAVLALIDDIEQAKIALADSPQADEVLRAARKAHRLASFRWDFIASENSTGFHSPQESMRVLLQASDIARRGQLELQRDLKKQGLAINSTTRGGAIPQPSKVIANHNPPVGSIPPSSLQELDQKQRF